MGVYQAPSLGDARVLVRSGLDIPFITDSTSRIASSSLHQCGCSNIAVSSRLSPGQAYFKRVSWSLRGKAKRSPQPWQRLKISPPFKMLEAKGTQATWIPLGCSSYHRLGLRAVVAHDDIAIVTSHVGSSESLASLDMTQIAELPYTNTDVDNVEEESKPEDEHQTLACSNWEGMLVKEKSRRAKIAQANKGKVPWNKGRHHTPETIQKIREKTRIAMRSPEAKYWRKRVEEILKDLNIREKLRSCGKNQTGATKDKIRSAMKVVWELKRTSKVFQDTCVREWKEEVAEAARLGGLEDEELEWSTFMKLKQQLRQEAMAAAKEARLKQLELQKKAVKARRAAGCSEEHRKKISDAIRAKWEDPEYRSRVFEGMHRNPERRRRPQPQKIATSTSTANIDNDFIVEVLAEENLAMERKARFAAAHLNGHARVTLARPGISEGTQPVSSNSQRRTLLDRSTPLAESQPVLEKKSVLPELIPEEDGGFSAAPNTRSLPQEAAQPSKGTRALYVDPLASEKLEKIKRLREGRLVMELKRREAAERARMLMAEAERAASALEVAAGTDKMAIASLNETRRLLAEAARSIQTAELGKVDESLLPVRNSEHGYGASTRGAYTRTLTSMVAAPNGSPVFCPPLARSTMNTGCTLESELYTTTSSRSKPSGTSWYTRQGVMGGHKPNSQGTSPFHPNEEEGSQVDLSFARRDQVGESHVPSLASSSSREGIERCAMGRVNGRPQKSVTDVEQTPTGNRSVIRRWHRGRLITVESNENS